MGESAIFHVGILIADLERGIEQYKRVFGIEFNDIVEIENTFLLAGQVETVDVRLAVSKQAAPYFELIEMHDSGFFSGAEGLHHVGMWSPDFAATKDRLVREGVVVECEVLDDAGNPRAWFNTPASIGGTRVEFVDDTYQAAVEELIRGGGQ